jgi:hypothetical protein
VKLFLGGYMERQIHIKIFEHEMEPSIMILAEKGEEAYRNKQNKENTLQWLDGTTKKST